MVRAAYITCDSPEWHDIAVQMRERAGWQPVYWICEPRSRSEIAARFPGAITHARIDAYHMVSPPELADMPCPPLDEPLLRDFSQAQATALKMMDVMDSVDAFDFNARVRLFHQRLQYWRAVLLATKPDLCVFAFSGHVIYDYLVYELARYYGIRTVMFETTFNWALYFAMEDPLAGSLEIRDAYAALLAADDGGAVELPALYENHLSKVRGQYGQAMPWYMREQFANFPKAMAAALFAGASPRKTDGRPR